MLAILESDYSTKVWGWSRRDQFDVSQEGDKGVRIIAILDSKIRRRRMKGGRPSVVLRLGMSSEEMSSKIQRIVMSVKAEAHHLKARMYLYMLHIVEPRPYQDRPHVYTAYRRATSTWSSSLTRSLVSLNTSYFSLLYGVEPH